MKAPFPYFGGKTKVADIVWSALGDVKHYIEPFFGSGAVLLNRPKDHTGKIETVNDKDGFVCNVWRALQFSPDETARWCDWPVNHADLSARKMRLIANEKRLLENLIKDDKWHDPEMAGYWIWAASCWIGSGLTRIGQRPHIGTTGMGVHSIGQIPHISNAGMGVQDPYKTAIYDWFRELSERLRGVRVVCGEWTRVCGGKWQTNSGLCGMFFDPPYAVEDRADIYHHESKTVGKNVEEWCLRRGSEEKMRIVVAGYDGEYKTLEDAGWTRKSWSASGGYGKIGCGRGKENRHREILWFSPNCITGENEKNLL
jgi:DNA adenine methylase